MDTIFFREHLLTVVDKMSTCRIRNIVILLALHLWKVPKLGTFTIRNKPFSVDAVSDQVANLTTCSIRNSRLFPTVTFR